MAIKVNMDDWHNSHVLLAAAQGWCISEVGIEGSAHYLEIQRLDDALAVGLDWGVTIPQLDGDEAAVSALRAAWRRGEDHALLAYQIIKQNSPSEYHYWEMQHWCD